MLPYTKGFEELKAAMDGNDGVLSLPMQDLRDSYGVNRLGIHVRKNIHDKLLGMGIGHLPVELPEYQHDWVRLYTLGSPIAKVIQDLFDCSEEADERLKARFGGDTDEIIEKIRALVCE